MGKLFRVDGYWKDGKESFQGELFYEYDEQPLWLDDDEIMFYGMNEADIIDAINEGEHNGLEFVIEEYNEVDKMEYSDLVVEEIIELVKSEPNNMKMAEKVRKYINKLDE